MEVNHFDLTRRMILGARMIDVAKDLDRSPTAISGRFNRTLGHTLGFHRKRGVEGLPQYPPSLKEIQENANFWIDLLEQFQAHDNRLNPERQVEPKKYIADLSVDEFRALMLDILQSVR